MNGARYLMAFRKRARPMSGCRPLMIMGPSLSKYLPVVLSVNYKCLNFSDSMYVPVSRS